MDTYLHISADEEKNIAVIKIDENEKIVESEKFREKLHALLEEYFGLPVKIHSLEQLDFIFIEVRVMVTIGDGEHTWSTNIYLNETWIY